MKYRIKKEVTPDCVQYRAQQTSAWWPFSLADSAWWTVDDCEPVRLKKLSVKPFSIEEAKVNIEYEIECDAKRRQYRNGCSTTYIKYP